MFQKVNKLIVTKNYSQKRKVNENQIIRSSEQMKINNNFFKQKSEVNYLFLLKRVDDEYKKADILQTYNDILAMRL
jgi:hypothetical protein